MRYAQPCLSPTRVCWMGGSVLGPLVVRPGPHALLAPVVMHMGFGAKWISGLRGGCVGSEGHDSSVTDQQAGRSRQFWGVGQDTQPVLESLGDSAPPSRAISFGR